MKRIILFVVSVFVAGSVWALGDDNAVQLGVRVGVFSQDMELDRAGFRYTEGEGDNKIELGNNYATEGAVGFNIALSSRIRIADFSSGALDMGFYFQPEIIYSQNNYKIQRTEIPQQQPDKTTLMVRSMGKLNKIRMQSIEIPVLLSFKVSILRAQFGPVFKAMYTTGTIGKGNIKLATFRPLVGWSAGLSVDIIAGLVIDGRYNGQFKQFRNHVTADSHTYRNVRGRLSSWSVGVGYMF